MTRIRTRLLNREAKADRTTLAGRAIVSGKVEQIEDIFEDSEYWLQGRAAETAGIARCWAFRCYATIAPRVLLSSRAGSRVDIRLASSNWSERLLTKPSSRSKTHACSTKCRRAREISRSR